MVFSDLFFLFVFLPALIICYRIAAIFDRNASADDDDRSPKLVWRNSVLIVFSLIFYAWGEPVYVFLMIGCVIMNYLFGLWVDACRRRFFRRLALTVGILFNVSTLGVFKYAGFVCAELSRFGIDLPVPAISLPIGISFYIFQSISYLTDVYRSHAAAQRRFSGLLLYISMFPQLVAGPIVRYSTVAREIYDRTVTPRDVADGIFRFLIGLGKKVIIANQMSEIADNFLTDNLASLSTLGAWVGLLAFTLQIYFDFSGYSDMAIGMGRCMGFHFPENFDHPYTCRSITDFWRRWHMSLGSFFRDYVYIPLGGNRSHQVLNIIVVWALTGFWHGASWNFVMWGMYFGIILIVEKAIMRYTGHQPGHIIAMLLVIAGWGIFYYDDLDNMGQFFRAFFGYHTRLYDFAAESALFDKFWLWILAIVLCLPVRRWISEAHIRLWGGNPDHTGVAVVETSCRLLLAIVILVTSVCLLVGATNNAFLYTRF